MVNDELVDLIAETIYRHVYDLPYPSDLKLVVPKRKDYTKLTEQEKLFFLTVAHDVMCVYDNYYDEEYDEYDEEYDDDGYDNEDIAMEEEEPDDDTLDYWEL